MKGLELSKQFYMSFGKEMLENQFSHAIDKLAVGLVGSGSECNGFDDNVSKDHDFEPGFCIFIPDESILDRKTAFELERAYNKLPKEFMGYKREILSPIGGNRHGVICISDFYSNKLGNKNGDLSIREWFTIEENYLNEATNGELFFDNLGKFSEIRQKIAFYPYEIMLKKLAGNLIKMAQSGKYNYIRCVQREDSAGAQLCLFEFINSAISSIYLLNRKYKPYYKWVFRGLKDLQILGSLYDSLEFLISNGNDSVTSKLKIEVINDICNMIILEIKKEILKDSNFNEIDKIAYELNDKIENNDIRNMNILAGV